MLRTGAPGTRKRALRESAPRRGPEFSPAAFLFPPAARPLSTATMISPLRPVFLFVCAGLAALPVFTGCTETTEAKSAEMYYQVRPVRTVAVELDHPAYDPNLPGYWLVGNDSLLPKGRGEKGNQAK